MCGIAGIFGPNWERPQLEAMVVGQRHRGPDAEGVYVDPAGEAGLVSGCCAAGVVLLFDPSYHARFVCFAFSPDHLFPDSFRFRSRSPSFPIGNVTDQQLWNRIESNRIENSQS